MSTSQQRPERPYRPPWGDASLFPDRVGVPWWAAVLLAVGLASAGAFADLQRLNRLGLIFQACYFLGCLLAIAVVARRGLFGPTVQPPLILAVAVPGVVLLAGGAPSGGGLAGKALSVATPLINGFPTMAITTILTVAVGAFRLITQPSPAARQRSPRPREQRSARPREQRSPRPREQRSPRPREQRSAGERQASRRPATRPATGDTGPEAPGRPRG